MPDDFAQMVMELLETMIWRERGLKDQGGRLNVREPFTGADHYTDELATMQS